MNAPRLRMTGYEQAIEIKMQRLFASLSEKDRRRYAAIEAAKLGHGGIGYVAALFGLDPKTVRHGLAELERTSRCRAGSRKRRGAEGGG